MVKQELTKLEQEHVLKACLDFRALMFRFAEEMTTDEWIELIGIRAAIDRVEAKLHYLAGKGGRKHGKEPWLLYDV